MKTTTRGKLFNKAGNAAGFTAQGFTITGVARAGGWSVDVIEQLHSGAQHQISRQTFATGAEADTYALSLIDSVKTEELKWWS